MLVYQQPGESLANGQTPLRAFVFREKTVYGTLKASPLAIPYYELNVIVPREIVKNRRFLTKRQGSSPIGTRHPCGMIMTQRWLG